jgi:hypothetical protein
MGSGSDIAVPPPDKTLEPPPQDVRRRPITKKTTNFISQFHSKAWEIVPDVCTSAATRFYLRLFLKK